MASKFFFFKKPNISAFKRRVWNLYITPRYEEPAISLKKSEKKHPETGFAMRVSICEEALMFIDFSPIWIR